MKAFQAKPGATVGIDVADSSDNDEIDFGGCNAIRVFNEGTATAWIRFGPTNTVSAAIGEDVPIGAGITEVLTPGAEQMSIFVAAIADDATGMVYFTPGIGI